MTPNAQIGNKREYLEPIVNLLPHASPNCRFVIALHSPYGFSETGLRVCPSEKDDTKLAAELGRTLSPVQFESNS